MALLGTSSRLRLRDDHDQYRTGPQLSYRAVVNGSEHMNEFLQGLRWEESFADASTVVHRGRAFEMNACKLNKGFGDKSAANQHVPFWQGAQCGQDGFQGAIQASKPRRCRHHVATLRQSILALWAESCQLQQLSPETHGAIVSCITGALLLGPTSMVLPCELMCFSRLRYQEETGGGGPTPPHGLRDVAVEPIKTRGLSPRRAWVDERRMIMSKWH